MFLVLDFNNHTLLFTEANYLVITNQVSEPLIILNDCHIKEPSYLYTLDTTVRDSVKRIRISDYLYIKYNSFDSNITKEINNHRGYDENYGILLGQNWF